MITGYLNFLFFAFPDLSSVFFRERKPVADRRCVMSRKARRVLRSKNADGGPGLTAFIVSFLITLQLIFFISEVYVLFFLYRMI